MREGRRRPSLRRRVSGTAGRGAAAMREGRRRPSLSAAVAVPSVVLYCRNEGGAPAPLVVLGLKSDQPQVYQPQ